MSNQNEEKKQESAPAVVGLIKVSDELLDFSSLKRPTKKTEAMADVTKKDGELTPREKAILERLKAKADK